MQYTIGADPELFIEDRATNTFVSAHLLVPGSKRQPFEVRNGAIQPDGVAAEFNINPAVDHEQFSNHIFTVVNQLTDIIHKQGGYKLRLVARPTAEFEAKYFRKLPAQVKALGCEPDYSVWTQRPVPHTMPKGGKPFRTGGGHLHIGWTEDRSVTDPKHLEQCHRVVKQLDSILYLLSKSWDGDTKRRQMYGTIGSYRPKSYGVEYRPLSNAWVLSPELHKFIFNSVIYGLKALENGDQVWTMYPETTALLRTAAGGKEVDDLDLLDHYYRLFTDGMCEELPNFCLENLETFMHRGAG